MKNNFSTQLLFFTVLVSTLIATTAVAQTNTSKQEPKDISITNQELISYNLSGK